MKKWQKKKFRREFRGKKSRKLFGGGLGVSPSLNKSPMIGGFRGLTINITKLASILNTRFLLKDTIELRAK
jgi:hypothetical protein